MITSSKNTDLTPRVAVLRQVISPSRINAIRARCDRGIEAVTAQTHLTDRDVEKLVSAWSNDCAFIRASMEDLRAELLAAARGAREAWIDLGDATDATLFVASGHHDRGTHAHQDIAYRWNRPAEDRYAYTTWLPLDPCDEEHGALCFSDAIGRLPVIARQDFLHPDFVDLATTSTWRDRESVISVMPGDVVIFDACTWHASKAFRGPGRRSALAIRWTSRTHWEREVPLPRPSATNDVFGMDSSGAILSGAIDRAQGITPAPGEHDRVRRSLSRLLEAPTERLERLPLAARESLRELNVALELQQHGARPTARVWRQVRDIVLPALICIDSEETSHELA